MAVRLLLNGATSYLPIPLYYWKTNDSIKCKFVHRAGSGDRFIFGGYKSGDAGRWQIESYNNKPYCRVGSNSSGSSGMPTLVDGQKYITEIRKTGDFWELFLDGVSLWSVTNSFTPLPLDAIGASGNGSFISNMEMEWLTTTTRHYSAASSFHGAGTTIVNDIGVDNLDATGIGFPTDGSQWFNVGGTDINAVLSLSNQTTITIKAQKLACASVAKNNNAAITLKTNKIAKASLSNSALSTTTIKTSKKINAKVSINVVNTVQIKAFKQAYGALTLTNLATITLNGEKVVADTRSAVLSLTNQSIVTIRAQKLTSASLHLQNYATTKITKYSDSYIPVVRRLCIQGKIISLTIPANINNKLIIKRCF